MNDLVPIAARALLYSGVLVAIGEVSSQWSRGDSRRDRLAPDDRPRTLIAWLALLTALLMLFVAQFIALELAPSSADVAMLVRGTTWGEGWLLLTVCALTGAIAAGLRAPWIVRAVIVAALSVAMGGLGHAAADESAPWLSRALDAGHVLGMGAWIGTLLCLTGDVARSTWARFSRMAVVAAPLVVATGVGSAWRRLSDASIAQSFASDYGRLLMAKVVIVAIVIALGARHRRHVLQRGAPTRTSVQIELGLAAVTLMVTAVLTGTAPPPE